MKCPKCDYLGFDTGDRCKNCGYDFSLVTAPPAAPAATPSASASVKAALPLFTVPAEDDDEPLIKLPAAPRPPLSVRKTRDTPRLRALPKPSRRSDLDPVLAFVEESAPDPDLKLRDLDPEPVLVPGPASTRGREGPAQVEGGPSSAGPRFGAAALDHLILLTIDAAVIYFTLRMAALTPADWQLLPPVPLVTFLLLVKFAYFCAFTAVGGQTIGKMAFNIRVVADDDGVIEPGRAVRRTLAGLLSSITLGLGFIPALLGDRRALHDRIAHTRVVALRSA